MNKRHGMPFWAELLFAFAIGCAIMWGGASEAATLTVYRPHGIDQYACQTWDAGGTWDSGEIHTQCAAHTHQSGDDFIMTADFEYVGGWEYHVTGPYAIDQRGCAPLYISTQSAILSCP